MKTSEFFKTFVLLICASIFFSCLKEEEGRKITGYNEYTITVASEKVPGLLFSSGDNHVSEVYAIMKEHSAEWEQLGEIKGFEYEPGYEYTIRISETNYLDHSMGEPAWTEHELMEVISKEKKYQMTYRTILFPTGSTQNTVQVSTPISDIILMPEIRM